MVLLGAADELWLLGKWDWFGWNTRAAFVYHMVCFSNHKQKHEKIA